MPNLDDVRATLESARHGYLSTASAEADPHLQPVVFQVVADSIYIAIDEKPKTTLRLRRLTNIESNPKFALLVDHYDDDWNQLWWILLRGPPKRSGLASGNRRKRQRPSPRSVTSISNTSRWVSRSVPCSN